MSSRPLTCLAAFALCGITLAASAQSATPRPTPTPGASAGIAAGTLVGTRNPAPGGPIHDYGKFIGLKAISTQVQGDFTSYTLPGGYTDIGRPMTVKCTATCVVVVEQMVTVDAIDGLWLICPLVDDNTGLTGCPWQGLTRQFESPTVVGNGTFVWHLAAGTHTLQPTVYLVYGGALTDWTLVATLYQ